MLAYPLHIFVVILYSYILCGNVLSRTHFMRINQLLLVQNLKVDYFGSNMNRIRPGKLSSANLTGCHHIFMQMKRFACEFWSWEFFRNMCLDFCIRLFCGVGRRANYVMLCLSTIAFYWCVLNKNDCKTSEFWAFLDKKTNKQNLMTFLKAMYQNIRCKTF